MRIHARKVYYDGDRATLIAHGDVDLEMSDGVVMHAQYFAMDVKNNRFLMAGKLRVDGLHGVHLQGAAISEFLDFGRAYYIPVAGGPDRWTYLNGDFAHPLRGRENPGDAFSMPEESRGRAFLTGRRALILPREEIHFYAAMLDTGVTDVPVPNYVLNLSSNPNFAQNSLSGANWDASYPFAGSTHASTAFHIRENQTSGLFGAVEQRIVGQKSYLVGSIAPIDKEQKQYNLLGSTHPSPRLQVEGFAQENAFQQGFGQPLNASGYLNGRVTKALPNSYLQLTVDQFYQSLLGAPQVVNGCQCYGGNPDHAWVPNHPVQVNLNWIGSDERIKKLPLHYRLRSGYGYAHDRGYGVVAVNATNFDPAVPPVSDPIALLGVGVPTITHNTVGYTLYTSAIRLSRDRHGNSVNLNGTLDQQHEGYSLPHHTNTTNSSVSVSKVYGTKAAAFVAYTTTNIADNYGSQQAIAYASSLPGFSGFGTLHTISESLIYTPQPDFNLTLINQSTRDYFGETSSGVSGEARVRLRRHLTLDVSRIYYYGGNSITGRWSPRWGILLGG